MEGNSGLDFSWMKFEQNLYPDIIRNQAVEELLALSKDEKEDFLWALFYHYFPDKPLHELNEVQKTLYLASRLEDTCQADGLPNLEDDEDIFLALPEIKQALERLGAHKTAALFDEFIALVPTGTIPEWSWFFEDERWDIISRIDSKIGNYPDGRMRDLYVAYISDPQNAKQVLLNLP